VVVVTASDSELVEELDESVLDDELELSTELELLELELSTELELLELLESKLLEL